MAQNIMTRKRIDSLANWRNRPGETLTQAVIVALRERLERLGPRSSADDDLVEEVMLLAGRFFAASGARLAEPGRDHRLHQHGVPR